MCVCVCCSEAAAHAVATLAEATLQGGQIVLAGETAAAVGALTGVQDGSGTNNYSVYTNNRRPPTHTHTHALIMISVTPPMSSARQGIDTHTHTHTHTHTQTRSQLLLPSSSPSVNFHTCRPPLPVMTRHQAGNPHLPWVSPNTAVSHILQSSLQV